MNDVVFLHRTRDIPESATHPYRPASKGRKRRRSPGWVPNQHGAWGMLLSPIVVGIVATRPTWSHLPLTLTWVLGYFAFNATSLWLKAARRPRYLAPMRAYVIATAVAGFATLVCAPALVLWAPLFAGLSGIALWEAAHRRDRSLMSGLSTVVAAACMTFVVMDAAGPLDVRRAGFLGLAQAGYFVGVLLYVKTMIRKRGDRRFLGVSIAWHAAVTLIAAAVSWPLSLVYALALIRSIVLPSKSLRPKQVGLGEIPLHLLVVVAALLS